MTAARQVDVEQDREDLEEDARQALVDRAAAPDYRMQARVRRDTRAAMAPDPDEED